MQPCLETWSLTHTSQPHGSSKTQTRTGGKQWRAHKQLPRLCQKKRTLSSQGQPQEEAEQLPGPRTSPGWHSRQLRPWSKTISDELQERNQFLESKTNFQASQVESAIKNPPANAGDRNNTDSIPASGRSPGEGNNNPVQYSWQENPMNRGARQATGHGVTKSQTQLK